MAPNTQARVENTSSDAATIDGFPLLEEDMNKAVSPADNFYEFANGGWVSRTEIPADYPRWGTFEKLGDDNNAHIKVLLEEEIKNPDSLVGNFYASAMNEERANEAGIKPLQPLFLEKISQIKDASDLARVLGLMHSHRLTLGFMSSAFFVAYAMPDAKNSSQTVFHLAESGLGLGTREYYEDEDKAEIRKQYREYLEKLFKVAGFGNAAEKADEVFDIEKQLASFSRTRLEKRDVEKNYNKLTPDELRQTASTFNWELYFEAVGVSKEFVGPVVVNNPSFFKEVSALLETIPFESWKSYLQAFVLSALAPYLSNEFVQLYHSFFNTVLRGQKELRPRFKRVVDAIGAVIPHALDQPFVAKHFPQKAKDSARELVEYLRIATKEKIESLAWMEPETKEKALKKLMNFGVKIGFPDKWDDYTALKISADAPYITNYLEASKGKFKRMIDNVNKPVDVHEWFMPTFMVNAYYAPTKNEIVFPAAILQPPFFYPPTEANPEGFPSINFGAIGVVIGHEMTHGYDDQGRKFDHNGNMVDWWTPRDAESFKERAQRIIDQFADYKHFDANLNGQLTQGENIADLGGLRIGYVGLQKWMEQNKRLPDANGFTPEQQFFLAYARLWRNVITKENALWRIANDPHSAGIYRVNGPLSNLEEFYQAFEVKAGAPMHRSDEKRVEIW